MENFLRALIEAQAAAGLEVAALVHSHKPAGPPSRFDVSQPPPWIIRAPCHGRLLYAPISPSFPFWMDRVLCDFRPDVLHFHLPNTSAFWALASARARKIPWVIHWHADVVESALDRRLAFAYLLYRPFEQAMLKNAQVIIATSPPYLNTSPALRDWLAKCQVIPLGLAKPAANPPQTASAIAWQPALLRVLAIGRLTYYKGFDTLIRAIAQVPFAQAILVGEGDQRSQLQSILIASGATDRITLAGSLPDDQMQALQDSCDVFCLPSLERTEAFGVVLLEAMQRGKAIIASAIPGSGVGWVVEHEKSGLLFTPGDVNSLAACFKAINDAQMRLQLGQAGRSRFEQHFSIGQVAANLNNIYQLAAAPA